MTSDVLSGGTSEIRLGGSVPTATLARVQTMPTQTQPQQSPIPADTGKMLPQAPPEPVDLSRMTENLNRFLKTTQRNLSFRVDEQSGRTIITVLNPETGEIVRQ